MTLNLHSKRMKVSVNATRWLHKLNFNYNKNDR